MQERLQYAKVYPDAYKAMLALTHAVEKTGFPSQLIDLVDYRVSQLNGCAACLDMHSKDLRARRGRAASLHDQRMARGAASLQRLRTRCAGVG